MKVGLNEIENAKKLLKEFGTAEAFGPEQADLNAALRNAVQADILVRNPMTGAIGEGEFESGLNKLGFKAGEKLTSRDTAIARLDNMAKGLRDQLAIAEGREVGSGASEKPNMTNYEKAMQGMR